MKCYVVMVTGIEWGIDTTPFIVNDRVFKTRAAAMREAQSAAECFVKANPDTKLSNYSTYIVVSSNNAGTTRSFSVEELEFVEE